jgi:hypothetical protein
VDSIYTDFFKAFNKVRHRLLMDIMSTDVEPSPTTDRVLTFLVESSALGWETVFQGIF